MTRRPGWLLAAGLLVALLLAGVVSGYASGSPDGLDRTAREGCTFDAEGRITGGTCMAQREGEHQLDDSPLAGYGIRGVDGRLSTGLSGVLGVLVTFGIGAGVFRLVRRRETGPATQAQPGAGSGAPTEPGAGSGAPTEPGTGHRPTPAA